YSWTVIVSSGMSIGMTMPNRSMWVEITTPFNMSCEVARLSWPVATTLSGGRLIGMPAPVLPQIDRAGSTAVIAGRLTLTFGTVITPVHSTLTPGTVAEAPTIETPGGV